MFGPVIPPANVEVAKVPVAWKLRAYGEDVAVTLPELSRPSSADDSPTFARFKMVPASKVSVPDVKLSEVSERRNWVESKVSKVSALELPEEIHDPSGIWKQPAERAIPLLKVDVAPDVNCNAPPLITIPELVALNPGAANPEYKVEVADWKFPTPCTDKIEPGVVVEIPRNPLESTVRKEFADVLLVPITNLLSPAPHADAVGDINQVLALPSEPLLSSLRA